jgi:hypothetical protein
MRRAAGGINQPRAGADSGHFNVRDFFNSHLAQFRVNVRVFKPKENRIHF